MFLIDLWDRKGAIADARRSAVATEVHPAGFDYELGGGLVGDAQILTRLVARLTQSVRPTGQWQWQVSDNPMTRSAAEFSWIWILDKTDEIAL